MKRLAVIGVSLAAALAAGVGGYWAGLRGSAVPGALQIAGRAAVTETAASPDSGPIIYYRDPDGEPIYSATPRQTEGGKPFVAVLASEDRSFAESPLPAVGGREPAAPGRLLYYRNPMGLPDTSRLPKKDSMGMDYIPVYEGADDGGPVVRIARGRLQRTGVRSELVTRHALSRQIRVPGTVQLDERRIAVVATRSDAFVEEVADVTTGDRVTKGQILVRLYSPEIAMASAQFLTDLSIAGRASSYGGGRQRLENLGIPAETVAEIERTRKPLLSMTWRASRDGIILERNAIDGMKAAPGDVLFRLADTSMVWILADVPELELGAVRLGAPATISIRSLPGRMFNGSVSRIYPQVDETMRSTRVRIEIANPDGVLLPNMYADVTIGIPVGALVTAVPDGAVIDTGTRQIVILDLGDGRFEPRDVKIVQRSEGFTEISMGVAEGDRVVVAANFLIDAESNLKAALQGMTPAEAQP